ncbi:putative dynactin arp1 p25 subunit [Rosellinia necatrix]|uniref:Putative dynactin arp1 p25 subunit n=1 Tax=Rosellinia necatrix TaxID=77044 RepID=A0A1W2TIM2_ROSNE|nr:putative dynactin arp1 p25 subunit [Rosellinia necatrix]
MVRLGLILVAVAAARGATATITEPLQFTELLRRQEPGSAAYKCHEACGQAIIQSRSSKDACNDKAFLASYDSCLQCAGPDNTDIWKDYGGTLSSVAAGCGLSTTPAGAQTTTPAEPTNTGSPASETSPAATTTVPTTTPGGSSTTGAASTTTTSEAPRTTETVQTSNNDRTILASFSQLYSVVVLSVLYALVC